MQYDPIKRTLGQIFSKPPFMRRVLYFLLDLLLLRTWHVNRALRKIASKIPANASVLDAGSGFGQYTWRMSRLRKGWKIKAVDINPEHIEECSRFFASSGMSERITFEQADLTELNDSEKYDLILSVDVMEHIGEDEKVFLNFFNALRPNGFLLISTPSDKGGSDVHNENESSFIEEHVREGYGIEDISRKLKNAGFMDIRSLYTYGKPGTVSWRLSMKYPVKLLNISKIFLLVLPVYYLLFFPVAFILNFFDLCMTHKTGTGLLVTANK
jgi:SAM-dependent methyltransferase